MMEYKGYIGTVTYDDQARIFHGEVINTRDVITFQGKTVRQIEKAFHDSIDDYIEFCESEGVCPEKPYSGKFNLRLSPELHKKVAIAAGKLNTSINKFVENILSDEVKKILPR
jgi:predicted HicB family RNase H-like nuclease